MLHNDNINSFEWVIRVLRKVFGYGYWKALKLTMQAHNYGQSIVWSGSLEVAELRAEQIVSCGPDPAMLNRGAQPLRVTSNQCADTTARSPSPHHTETVLSSNSPTRRAWNLRPRHATNHAISPSSPLPPPNQSS